MTSLVRVEARPDAFELDPSRTAVLVIDMQNDFGAKGGSFDRAGIDVSPIERAVAPTARVLDGARRAGLPVVYLKMGYADDLSDLGPPGSPNRERHRRLRVGEPADPSRGGAGRVLVRGSWGTEVLPALAPRPGDELVWKTRFSGFFETRLHDLLQAKGVTTLVVTGCTTSICVDSTVRDAMFRDYRCLLLADCMAEPIGNGLARTNHDATLLAVEVLLGWVATSADLLAALRVGLHAPSSPSRAG